MRKERQPAQLPEAKSAVGRLPTSSVLFDAEPMNACTQFRAHPQLNSTRRSNSPPDPSPDIGDRLGYAPRLRELRTDVTEYQAHHRAVSPRAA
jgi:hypothetical protein